MKLSMKPFFALPILVTIVLFSSCSNDKEEQVNQAEEMEEEIMEEMEEMEETVTVVDSKTFDLGSVADSDISGTAKFISKSDNSLAVELKLTGTPAGGMHPASIHFNTAAEGGDVALTLGIVNGDTGESSVDFTTLDDGTAITYAELLDFDGYINVHVSADDLETLVAQGDIGQNELTGKSIEYILKEFQIPDNQGSATFFERVNGEALAILTVNNNAEQPAYMYSGDIKADEGIIFTFSPLIPFVLRSSTNVSMLDDGTPFGYSDILTVDGHIKVRDSEAPTSEIIVQGNIGSNAGAEGETSAADFDVTNQGAIAYIFNGGGLANVTNPDVTLKRGETYTFTINTPGHPFFIKSIQSVGTTNTYNEGVTNNGEQDGELTFVVPMNAPDTLFYNCEFHISMTGELNIID